MKQEPYFDEPFKDYWYDEQLKRYILQFMAIFDSMKIAIGKNDFNSQTNLIKVPIRYAGVDRVVDAILAGNTQNKPPRFPLFAAKLLNITKAPDAQKGTGAISTRVYLPKGGTFPDNLKVVRRRVPTPYRLDFELNLFTTNEDQRFQITEQILSIFDPLIQIQTSDNAFDWSKITELYLDDVGFDDNYPSAQDKRFIVTNFKFYTIGWLSLPENYKSDFIKSIYLKLSTIDYGKSIQDEIVYYGDDAEYDKIIDSERDLPDLPKK